MKNFSLIHTFYLNAQLINQMNFQQNTQLQKHLLAAALSTMLFCRFIKMARTRSYDTQNERPSYSINKKQIRYVQAAEI